MERSICMKTSLRAFVATGIIFCVSWPHCANADDWLRFRGENGAGVSTDSKIPSVWGDQKNLAWKAKLPGAGFSSPIITGNKVLVTCYTGADGNLKNLKRQILCFDRKSGKKLWENDIPAVLPEFRSQGRFAYHGYASSTPVTDGKMVYVLFGTTGVIAFDLEGKKVWQKSVGKESNAMFGSASSPILYKDSVIVTAGAESQAMYAFDKTTGKQLWKSDAASLSGSYSTPILIRNRGQDELVISVMFEIWSMNPETGKLNWYAETGVDTGACTSVVANDGIVYVVGGRNGSRAAVKVEGDKDSTKPETLWKLRGGTYVPSPVYYKDHVYYVTQRGVVTCLDAKTGKEVSTKRLGGDHYASPTVVNGKLICISRFDGAYVLEASPKLEVISHNTFSDKSDFSGSPAIANGQMFIRSDAYLYCIADN